MIGLLALTAAFVLPAPQPSAAQTQPVGVDRFNQVDDKLYRGAQPDAEGFKHLKNLGIHTVINLRTEKDAEKTGERRIVESLGMRYISIPIEDGSFFTRSRIIPDEAIRKFFEEFDAAAGPVFVHCRRGADRTGALVAFYRVARNGWDNQRAYEEARAVGMRSWYSGLKRQILNFKAGPAFLSGTPRS
jgi:uncharacterized protein (TIGR01244 family)